MGTDANRTKDRYFYILKTCPCAFTISSLILFPPSPLCGPGLSTFPAREHGKGLYTGDPNAAERLPLVPSDRIILPRGHEEGRDEPRLPSPLTDAGFVLPPIP